MNRLLSMSGVTSIFKGVELSHLQSALNAGAITLAEYDKLRTILLRRPN